MATDATGTPTSPDSIPTFDTGTDNPSGVGFNNAMAAIQTAFDNHVDKPSGVASGEVPVWNGSAWVRSSATRIGLSSIEAGSAGDVLGGTGPSYTKPPGYEIAYQTYSTDQTTTSTSLVDLLTFSAATFEAIKYYFEISIPNLRASIATNDIAFRLMEGASPVSMLIQFETHPTVGVGVSAFARIPFTPTAASHTYKVQWQTVFAATATIKASIGDAVFRIVKA